MGWIIETIQSLGVWAWGLSSALLLHLLIQIVVGVRVVMSRRGVGETLSWILVVLVLPVVGALLYLLIGELRLGRRRARLIESLAGPVKRRLGRLDRYGEQVRWSGSLQDCEQLARAGRNLLHVPALHGNRLELEGNWEVIFDRLIEDIDSATVNCDFEFYIWNPGGRSDEVVAAIERARQRNVTCRILVDSLGSRRFLRSADARRLRQAGVEIRGALPDALWRLPFRRFDLRMHRKIVLIDDHVAWTGSLNLVDPRYFKQDAGVGQWVDAMVRLEGPAVEALAITFQTDWQIESGVSATGLPDLTGEQPLQNHGNSIVQVLPSGPAFSVESIEQLLITAIYTARREVVITSPYFVPSEALQMALVSAAKRGLRVVVIVPAVVDSVLVRLASRAFKGYLLASGVHIALFEGGLLHTKSVTIDGRVSLFGSLNMDPRSLRLNFEITLAVFDEGFTGRLCALQESYLVQSRRMDLEAWNRRSLPVRLVENIARLLGPLL